MSINGAKIYFVIPILGGIPMTQTMLSSLLVTLLLCIVGYRLGKHLKKRPGPAQVLTEKAISTLYNLVSDTMGPTTPTGRLTLEPCSSPPCVAPSLA